MTEKKRKKLIRRIAYILRCGYEHSSDAEVWGDQMAHEGAYYYAYSHVSYVCVCLWERAAGEPLDAEFFLPLLNSPPEDWVDAVTVMLTMPPASRVGVAGAERAEAERAEAERAEAERAASEAMAAMHQRFDQCTSPELAKVTAFVRAARDETAAWIARLQELMG